MKSERGTDRQTEEKERGWDEHIHIMIHEIDNQQAPTIKHRKVYWILWTGSTVKSFAFQIQESILNTLDRIYC